MRASEDDASALSEIQGETKKVRQLCRGVPLWVQIPKGIIGVPRVSMPENKISWPLLGNFDEKPEERRKVPLLTQLSSRFLLTLFTIRPLDALHVLS